MSFYNKSFKLHNIDNIILILINVIISIIIGHLLSTIYVLIR